MSLYRTWRPKSFTDLVGQDAVVRTLRAALASDKLAHAYLFSGPRGSGKTSAAKILARCIDCECGPTPEPDNSCPNCLAMLAGTALDVIEIDAASNRGIDEIRSLRDSAKFAPASMRMKVFIIDEAHMLTREGANAFLKTLEEPPPHVVFILATTAPEALPPTILSRCQRYAFRRIPVSVMIARMREIADAEGIAIDDGALGAIAYRADGGLRDALTMLEQVASYAGGAVDAASVDAAFGATGRQYARAVVDAILAAQAATALRIVDEASDAGADMLGLIRGAIGEYRNLLVARIDRDLLARDLSVADADAVVALAGATAQPRIVRGLRLLADALAAGRLSGNPRLELETAVLRLIVQGEDPSLEALATRVALLEAGFAPLAPAAAATAAGRDVPVRADAPPGVAPLRREVSVRNDAPVPSDVPIRRNVPVEGDAVDADEPDPSIGPTEIASEARPSPSSESESPVGGRGRRSSGLARRRIERSRGRRRLRDAHRPTGAVAVGSDSLACRRKTQTPQGAALARDGRRRRERCARHRRRRCDSRGARTRPRDAHRRSRRRRRPRTVTHRRTLARRGGTSVRRRERGGRKRA
ncbi:MAG: hypothetical protein NVSMB59_01000 [Vulcanimicrobiaceae bacterium]